MTSFCDLIVTSRTSHDDIIISCLIFEVKLHKNTQEYTRLQKNTQEYMVWLDEYSMMSFYDVIMTSMTSYDEIII